MLNATLGSDPYGSDGSDGNNRGAGQGDDEGQSDEHEAGGHEGSGGEAGRQVLRFVLDLISGLLSLFWVFFSFDFGFFADRLRHANFLACVVCDNIMVCLNKEFSCVFIQDAL
jgi:hypothetical protein